MPVGDLLEASGESFIFILDAWDSVFYRDFMTERDRQDYQLWKK